MSLYYKYLPPDRLSYLSDELLRYTQPIDLNDPFECLPKKPSEKEFNKVVETLVSLFLKSNFLLSDIASGLNLDQMYQDSYLNVNNDIGILSLTKKWKNTLMWAHYSTAHKGFCVGFDPNHEYFKDYLSPNREQSKTIKQVVYSDKRVEIPMNLEMKKLAFEPFITKSKDWEYEEEVRIIATLNLSHKQIPGNNLDIHLFKVPHTSIKEIIAGANIDENNEALIKDFCERNEVQFYKAKISEEIFDMDRV